MNKIQSSREINTRYYRVTIDGRYFILDYANPFNILHYFPSLLMYKENIRAWEVTKSDLRNITYKGSKSSEGKQQTKSIVITWLITLLITLIPMLSLVLHVRRGIGEWLVWITLVLALLSIIRLFIGLFHIPKIDTSNYKRVKLRKIDKGYKGTSVVVIVHIGIFYGWIHTFFIGPDIMMYVIFTSFVFFLTFMRFLIPTFKNAHFEILENNETKNHDVSFRTKRELVERTLENEVHYLVKTEEDEIGKEISSLEDIFLELDQLQERDDSFMILDFTSPSDPVNFIQVLRTLGHGTTQKIVPDSYTLEIQIAESNDEIEHYHLTTKSFGDVKKMFMDYIQYGVLPNFEQWEDITNEAVGGKHK